ncbi:MAG: hypothetical protein PVG75_01600 [Thioalkalispiraceae bacterium]|jgi:hypothetical protein
MAINLIWDKTDCMLIINGLHIQAAPKDFPPFYYTALVEEQDTHLLLREQTTISDPGKPSWYLANILEDEDTFDLGTIVIKGKNLQRLMAIVHDIDKTPTCRSADILAAYLQLSQVVTQLQLKTIALSLLGTVQGKLPIEDAMAYLKQGFLANTPPCLEKMWLILPDEATCQCLDILRTD